MYICILHEVLVPREVRRGLPVFWNCRYSWLWATVFILGIKSGSFARATSSLQYSNSNLFILIQLWEITHTQTYVCILFYHTFLCIAKTQTPANNKYSHQLCSLTILIPWTWLNSAFGLTWLHMIWFSLMYCISEFFLFLSLLSHFGVKIYSFLASRCFYFRN